MPALPAIASVASAAAAVAGVVVSHRGVQQQRRAAKKQEQRFKEQQDAAREAARLESTRTDTGARVRLGSAQDGEKRRGTQAQQRTGTVANVIGGLGTQDRYGI